uniref:Uncharacterized protein n=2 Tax=Pseudomonadaceae TaxID=135621 RepID=A0A6H1Q645_9PSED|nr:hypothetical protein [Pseudomonas mendocina]QIZ22307.1 Hypothetical protein [Pseudomonas monteilii]
MRGLRPGLSCYASSHGCAASRPFGLQSLSPAHLARQVLRAPLALRPVGLRGGLLATLPPLRVLGVLITLRLAAISPNRLPSAGPMPSRGFRGICSLPSVAPLFHGPHDGGPAPGSRGLPRPTEG